MSARTELEARARAAFRAVMLSNHTAEKFASEAAARGLRLICEVFDEEVAWREKSKRGRLLKRARFPVPKTFEGYDWSRCVLSSQRRQKGMLTLLLPNTGTRKHPQPGPCARVS